MEACKLKKMKWVLLTCSLILGSITAHSQAMRYFEFRVTSNGNWVDTSFVVATSDQSLIDTVLSEITQPVSKRRFISGGVAYGNGGFNHNASHQFSWHFIPNDWALYFVNVEVCDGLPSGLDNHPALIAGDTGMFCPWSSYPFQEVPNPRLGVAAISFQHEISIYPNPASHTLFFERDHAKELLIEIYNMTGQRIFTQMLSHPQEELDIQNWREGVYFIKISDGNKSEVRKIVVTHAL